MQLRQYTWRAGAMKAEILAAETLALCAQLRASGCKVVAAHCHLGKGVVQVDRRPSYQLIRPGTGVTVRWPQSANNEGRRHD